MCRLLQGRMMTQGKLVSLLGGCESAGEWCRQASRRFCGRSRGVRQRQQVTARRCCTRLTSLPTAMTCSALKASLEPSTSSGVVSPMCSIHSACRQVRDHTDSGLHGPDIACKCMQCRTGGLCADANFSLQTWRLGCASPAWQAMR